MQGPYSSNVPFHLYYLVMLNSNKYKIHIKLYNNQKNKLVELKPLILILFF